jgi:hypothetical protein
MAYRGHVRNGIVELDEPASLPEGAEVSVEMVSVEVGAPDISEAADAKGASLYDRLRHVIGKVDDLPSDFSRNHDHYLYGNPKK